MAFLNAAYWAACLRRTLVAPAVVVPRASDPEVSWRLADLVPYDSVYLVAPSGGGGGIAIPYCGGGRVRVEALEAFARRGLRPERVLDVHAPLASDSLTDAFFDTTLGWGSVPRENLTGSGLCDGAISRRALRSVLGRNPERVLALNGMYRCRLADSPGRLDRIRRAFLRPAPAVDAVRRAVLGRLGAREDTDDEAGVRCGGEGRMCVQLRLGDFSDMCRLDLAWMRKRRAEGSACQPSSRRVRSVVAGWRGGCVLVLTNDEGTAEEVLGLDDSDGGNSSNLMRSRGGSNSSGNSSGDGDSGLEGKQLLMGSDLLEMLSEPPAANLSETAGMQPGRRTRMWQALAVLVVEQAACVGSARAVLNRFSTFGETVAFQRQAEGRETAWW